MHDEIKTSRGLTRRTALTAALAGGASACTTPRRMTPFTALDASDYGAFQHGVASGDPGPRSLVLWTRVTPAQSGAAGVIEAEWEIARDANFTDVAKKGVALTGPSRDWTVKVLVDDLTPGAQYFYRFRSGDAVSPTGKTRTLPQGALDAARFAVVSCANYAFGFFNAYDQIARREDFDAVIHLGDYLYEYGQDKYGGDVGARIGRNHAPAHETISLTDYRQRHAQYKTDPSCQAMHAAHPMIAIWDDHETSNNSWKDGAENHQKETEGDWNARRRAALQAYYEWMPVRDPAPGRPAEGLFRAYAYGDLLTLTALETRLMARSRQFEYSEVVPTLKTQADIDAFRDRVLWDESREMLGQAQRDYMETTLRKASGANHPWRLIANQIIMTEVIAPDLTPHVSEEDILELEKDWDQARPFVEFSALGLPVNLDAWDGYPAARERFYQLLQETKSEGVIVVTGDTHTWWANDLSNRAGDAMGVELGVASVTSPSPYRPEFLGGKGAEYALLTNRDNKAVRYLSGESHGYIDLAVGRETAEARYMAVDTIESRAYNAYEQAAFTIAKKDGTAAFKDADGLGFKEGFLF
ncbi:MAG: alkaline phosphatase D family protein [Pseudomonadota bacterium]